MKFRHLILLAGSIVILASSVVRAASENPSCDELLKLPPTRDVIPQPQPSPGWLEHFNRFKAEIVSGSPDVLMVGDSITEQWPHDLLQSVAPSLTFANAGFTGDGTQQVLWRLRNGGIPTQAPKAIVVLIGSRNATLGSRPIEIAQGVALIVHFLRERYPSSKILLLGLFPRGQDVDDPARQANKEASKVFSACADGKIVSFFQVEDEFLDAEGRVRPEVMPDFLHLSRYGYGILAGALRPAFKNLGLAQ